MKLAVTDWKQDTTGVVSYNIRVFAHVYEANKNEGAALLEEIAVVNIVTVANPTILQQRAVQRAALLGNMRVRTQRLAESHGNDLEAG